MNQGKRNIVLVGFTKEEIQKLELEDIRNQKETWTNKDITHRFPRLVFIDTWSSAKRHQGFLLFLKIEDDFDFVTYDIKYRKQFKNYRYVFLVPSGRSKIAYPYQIYNLTHIIHPYSKIAVIPFFYFAYHPSINQSIQYLYQYDLETQNKQLSQIRLKNVEKLNQYVKNKTYLDIKKTAFDLDVSTKWIERYLKDMNTVYQNVGYDRERKQFYITK